jgi:hypothetical protein
VCKNEASFDTPPHTTISRCGPERIFCPKHNQAQKIVKIKNKNNQK